MRLGGLLVSTAFTRVSVCILCTSLILLYYLATLSLSLFAETSNPVGDGLASPDHHHHHHKNIRHSAMEAGGVECGNVKRLVEETRARCSQKASAVEEKRHTHLGVRFPVKSVRRKKPVAPSSTGKEASVISVLGLAGGPSSSSSVKHTTLAHTSEPMSWDVVKPAICASVDGFHHFFLLDSSCGSGKFFEVQVESPTVRVTATVENVGDGLYRVSVRLVDAEHYTVSVWQCSPSLSSEELGKVPGCDTLVSRLQIIVSSSSPISVRQCTQADLQDINLTGRWVRLAEGEECSPPWCSGSLSIIHSPNRWVYVPYRCYFHLFSTQEAWDCLDGKWMMVWGDSTVQDTVRNFIEGVLDVQNWMHVSAEEVKVNKVYSVLPLHERTMDRIFNHTPSATWGFGARPTVQTVRVSMKWNGHVEMLGKYLGLATYRNASYVKWIQNDFVADPTRSPDVLFIHSGMHDARSKFSDEEILQNLDHAVSVWRDVVGSRPIPVIWRTVAAWAGPLRPPILNFRLANLTQRILSRLGNAHRASRKGEARMLFSAFLPFFDMTFPFHWDYSCSDGMHYGLSGLRKEINMKRFGHTAEYQTFVDRMLSVMMLNAICPTNRALVAQAPND